MKLFRHWPYVILPMRHGSWVPLYALEHGNFWRGLWGYLRRRGYRRHG